jgi:hypothetical protein
MITISYANGLIAVVAAAAIGAAGSGWMLYGALVETRTLAGQIRRWERRATRAAAWAEANLVALTLVPAPHRALRSGMDSEPHLSIVDVEAESDVNCRPDPRSSRFARLALWRNRHEVRRALRHSKHLLALARRHHVGRHRLDDASVDSTPVRVWTFDHPTIRRHRLGAATA